VPDTDVVNDAVATLQPVRGRWPGSCFVCSQGHPHGLGLRFYHTEDGVVSFTSIPSTYCGFDGMAHGGIISTLMDETAAYSLFARYGKLGVTRELGTRFLKPIPTGVRLKVVGRVASFTPPTAEVTMAIYGEGDELLAEGKSSWSFPRLSRIAQLAGVEERVLQEFLDDCQRMD